MTAKLFGAEWCANCKHAKPVLDQNAVAYEYVDIDQKMDEAQANNIRSLPTLITESGDRYVGLQKIKEYVASQSN